MLCPKCNSLDDKVIDSRLSKEGKSIRRRRECLQCHHRLTTYEEIERIEFLVVKRDGRREPFDRQKLQSSLIKASQKRPISLQVIDNAVLKILSYLESLEYHEIPTKLIGDELMKQLRNIDPIAYVRYASVYRAFQEVGEFIEEIQSLNDQSTNITIS